MSAYRWIRFGPDTLLISSRNMAHVPGACTHVTEEYVLDPGKGWGWIPHPDPAAWNRISTSTPAIATRRRTVTAQIVARDAGALGDCMTRGV